MGSDLDGESADDESGHSVSLSSDGTTVAISAHLNDGNGANSGHVRIYSFDTDGDGFPDTIDAFRLDYYENVDTDGDGTGNNADTDDDGDGVVDNVDAFPLDSSESVDTDGDGTGDESDAFPMDPEESFDTDSDGIGDVADADADGDGFTDDLEESAGGDPADPTDSSKTTTYLAQKGLSQSVLLSARELGRDDVESSPSSYGIDLYTASELETAAAAARTIVNVSSRVTLGSGEMVTPGFVVLGTSKKLLIRAVGPKLGDLGVGNPLPNPRMTVYRTR